MKKSELRRLIKEVLSKEDQLSKLKKFVSSLPSYTINIINKNILKFGEDGVEYALDSIMESGSTTISSKEEHNEMNDIIGNYPEEFVKLMNTKFKNRINWGKN